MQPTKSAVFVEQLRHVKGFGWWWDFVDGFDRADQFVMTYLNNVTNVNNVNDVIPTRCMLLPKASHSPRCLRDSFSVSQQLKLWELALQFLQHLGWHVPQAQRAFAGDRFGQRFYIR